MDTKIHERDRLFNMGQISVTLILYLKYIYINTLRNGLGLHYV